MVFELNSIVELDYSERIKLWPTKFTHKNSNFFANECFNDNHPNNFWLLSEQYYTIAWTLYSASFNERVKWPYSGNLMTFEKDKSHGEILTEKIKNNNWSDPVFLSFAHLSCELAFKAIILHKSKDIENMYYPKGHDLEKLLDYFNDKTKKSFIEQYENWEYKQDLNEILYDSGNKFIEQRYGNIESDNNSSETINLCRFIHEEFRLKNIESE
ncbi:MAG: hypothetical protein ACOH1N_09830 [Lutibacter sp.]